MSRFFQTYRRKNLSLVMAGFVFVIISYPLSFNRTMSLYKNNQILSKELALLSESELILKEQEAQLQSLNTSLGLTSEGLLSYQNEILKIVSAFCDSSETIIIQFPETSIEMKDGFQIETNHLTITGSFSSLLTLCHQIEVIKSVSHISSAKFTKSKRIRDKKEVLTLELILQNVKL